MLSVRVYGQFDSKRVLLFDQQKKLIIILNYTPLQYFSVTLEKRDQGERRGTAKFEEISAAKGCHTEYGKGLWLSRDVRARTPDFKRHV